MSFRFLTCLSSLAVTIRLKQLNEGTTDKLTARPHLYNHLEETRLITCYVFKNQKYTAVLLSAADAAMNHTAPMLLNETLSSLQG